MEWFVYFGISAMIVLFIVIPSISIFCFRSNSSSKETPYTPIV